MIRLFPSGSKKSKDKRDWNNCQCSCKFYGDSFIQSRRTKVVHGIPGGGSSGNGRGVIHSSVLTVSSSGVVQAVGVGTATVTAAAGNQICAYTIVVSMDSSMIVTEMDLSLSSNTIYVGNSVSASLLVRPSSGEHTFYKVKDANSIILTDSVGNEAEGETAKFYVLKKK